MHQRRLIREALVSLLAGGGTFAGTRVFDHPYDPRTVFPSLCVVDIVEQQGADSMPADATRPIERLYTIEVAAEVQQIANYARARDQLLAQVETIFASAYTTIAAVKSITPSGYSPTQDASGDRPIAIGRQRFDILYFTPQGAPATAL